MSDPSSPPAPPPFPEPTVVPGPDGVALATYDLGYPTSADGAAPLLFAHANGFCAAVWAPLAACFDGRRRVAFDLRGHGRSRPADHADGPADLPLSWDRHGADVLAVVDATGLERPVGIGHSMGGAALLLAELARPGTFSAMWLFEPIVFPPGLDTGGNPLEQGALRRRDRFEGPGEAFANFAAKPPLSALSPEALAAYVAHGFATMPDGSVRLRCAPEVEAAGYREGARHDAWGRLGQVTCPVTVARGVDNGFGPATFAPRLVERLRAGRLEDHPDLGHFGPLEDPVAVAASIRAVTPPA